MIEWSRVMSVFQVLAVLIGVAAAIAGFYAIITKRKSWVIGLTALTLISFTGFALLLAYHPASNASPGAITTVASGHACPQGALQSGQYQVNATNYWLDTKIPIRPGMHVTISYVCGIWSYSPTQPLLDAGGPPEQFICTQHCSLERCGPTTGPTAYDPNAVQGSLIARVGVGLEVHAVGDQASFVAQHTGDLSLAINDGFDSDNRGAIVVHINVA